MSLTNTSYIKTDLKTALLLLLHKKSEWPFLFFFGGGGGCWPHMLYSKSIPEHEGSRKIFILIYCHYTVFLSDLCKPCF